MPAHVGVGVGVGVGLGVGVGMLLGVGRNNVLQRPCGLARIALV